MNCIETICYDLLTIIYTFLKAKSIFNINKLVDKQLDYNFIESSVQICLRRDLIENMYIFVTNNHDVHYCVAREYLKSN